jgi:hypothetical protein
MRTNLIFVLLLLISGKYIAQKKDDVGKIALSLVMPENVDGLNSSQLSKVETKISQITTANGLGASGYNNNFVIYPKVAIYETSVVEGGMDNITVVTAEISLFIKQVDNNLLFGTISKQIKGSGSDKTLALTNAISKIPVNDKDFQTFIENSKGKIIAYYESVCNDILNQADTYMKMQDFEKAIGVLMSIPQEVSCYNNVKAKSIEVYKLYQNKLCKEQLLEAKSKIASQDYDGGLQVLSMIDPSSNCYNDAKTTIQQTENKVSAKAKKEWDFKMKQYESSVELEKERINAVKDIAVAYYKRNRPTYNYTVIVR